MKTFLNSLSRSPAHRVGGLTLALIWAASWILLGHDLDARAARSPHTLAHNALLSPLRADGEAPVSRRAGSEGAKGVAADSAVPTRAYRTKKIQDISVGERVMVDLPAEAHSAAIGKQDDLAGLPAWDKDEVDAATWRRVELAMPDENGGQFDIVLLRPLSWLEGEGAVAGRAVYLCMPEQGLDGPAQVTAVGPCPSLQSGSGRLVTGTFTHIRGGMIELQLAGLDKPIGVTENHPIYSVERREFVPAAELKIGETLQHLEGTTQVVAITPLAGEYRVYNFEVHGEHVYRVSSIGLLVHNASPWSLAGADTTMSHPRFGKFYRDPRTGLWWAKDRAGHGGSVYKVFRESGKLLEWIADADEFGDFIIGKHKGPTGLFIPLKEFFGS